jgi:spore coat protein U-like protein
MKMTKLFLLLASIGVLTISSDRGALAAPQKANANLKVSANVVMACTIATAEVKFVDYDPTAAAANDSGNGTVTITCTMGASPTVALALGAHASGTQRNMKDTASTATLQYGLFQDAARKIPWGDGGSSGIVFTPTPAITVTNDAIPIPVYGRIPALQNVPVSTFDDLVQATVNF